MEFSEMSGEVGSKECLNEVDNHLPSSYTGSFTRGSRYGQRQDELLQSMSSRYQTEYQYRRSREDQDTQEDPADCIRVDVCNFHNLENAERHNSNMYEIVQCEPSKPVYRRGLVFKMTIKFKNQGFDPRTDTVKLIFNFGPNPSVPKETKIILPLGYDRHDRDVEVFNYWEALITRCDRGSMDVEVYIPPDAPVGVWRCWVETCRRRLSRQDKPNRPQKTKEEKCKVKVQIREESKEEDKRGNQNQTQTETTEDSEENRNNDQRDRDQKQESTEETGTNEQDKTRQRPENKHEFVKEKDEDFHKQDDDSQTKEESRNEESQFGRTSKIPTRESPSYNMDYSSHPRKSSQYKRDPTKTEEKDRKDESSPTRSRSRDQQREESEGQYRKEDSKDDRSKSYDQHEEEMKKRSRQRKVAPYDPSTERMRGRSQRSTSPNKENERERNVRSGIQRQGKGPYRPERRHDGVSRQDKNQNENGHEQEARSRLTNGHDHEDDSRGDRDDSQHDRRHERAPYQRKSTPPPKERGSEDQYRRSDDYNRNDDGPTHRRPYRSHSGYQSHDRSYDEGFRSNDRSQAQDYYYDQRETRYQRRNRSYDDDCRSNDRSQTPEYYDSRRPHRSHSGYQRGNRSYDRDYRSNDRSETPNYYTDYDGNDSMERYNRGFSRSFNRNDRRGHSYGRDDSHRRSWSGFDRCDPYRERRFDKRYENYHDRTNRRGEGSQRRRWPVDEERYGESRRRYDSTGQRYRGEEESPRRRHTSQESYHNRRSRSTRDSPDRRNRDHISPYRRPRSMGRFPYEESSSRNKQRGYRRPGRGGPSNNETRRPEDSRGDYRRSQYNGRSRSSQDIDYNMERKDRDRSRREDDPKSYRSHDGSQRDAYYNERSRSYSPNRNQDDRFERKGSSHRRDDLDRNSSRYRNSRSPYSTDRRQNSRRHSFDDDKRRGRSASDRNKNYREQSQENTSRRPNFINRNPEDQNPRPWWHRERRTERSERYPTRQRQEEDTETQLYEETKDLFKCDDDIYILFNPWCSDDPTYMENEKWRREYVLNDTGKIWVGTYNNPTGRRWVYGQFDDAVLPAVMYLLEEARMSGNDRANPVRVCRAISEMVNNRDSSNNSNGRKNNGYQNNCVMDGRWDGNYDGGVSPYSWTGSPAILEQYLQTGKPVKYGQCWVFSALTTTICRALGIPCRSVTNFVSAHDTNNTLCIDKYFSCTGDEIQGGPDGDTWDSLWSFHSWNDVWMERSDLPPSYGGWQAIDSTFQEENDGLYKCGPASLEAIRRGEIGFSFDTPFIFTEINSEIYHWQEDGRSEWGFCKVKPHKYRAGRCILTKHPDRDDDEGDRDVQDVLQEYIPRDGRPNDTDRIMSQMRGMERLDQAKAERKNRRYDVEIELEEMRSVDIGDTVTLRMKIINRSNELRSVDAMMSCNSVYYTGVVKKRIKQDKSTIMMQPKSSDIFTMQVKAEDYNDKLVDYRLMKVYAAAKVRETRQVWSDEDDFCFNKPVIDIKVGEIRRIGEYMEVIFEFVNPLNVCLTNCRLAYECPFVQRATFTKFRDVGANERITFTELFLPREEGSTKIVATFSSHQLYELNGATNIFIRK